jgi:hypothetical protein
MAVTWVGAPGTGVPVSVEAPREPVEEAVGRVHPVVRTRRTAATADRKTFMNTPWSEPDLLRDDGKGN